MGERKKPQFTVGGRKWRVMDPILRQLLEQKSKESNLTDAEIARILNSKFPKEVGKKPLTGPDVTSRRRDLWDQDRGF